MFIWMPKEHLYVVVYLVTVMHSMQAGYMDKAQKYTDKALLQIEKLKIVDNKPILSVFQLMLLEHIVMCRLVMGNKSIALQVTIRWLVVPSLHSSFFTPLAGNRDKRYAACCAIFKEKKVRSRKCRVLL